ncbi:MAG: phage tail tape measure protein, partial [Solirubrobacterales bacterium]
MSAGVGALAVGAVGLAATMKSALAAGEFEQGVAKVGAISQASAEELDKLSAKAIQAGLDTQFSPKEAIDGLSELAVRGLTAQESIEALDGALDLAAGGQITIAQASSTTASALKVFGLEADKAGVAADKLLKISNVTALQAKDLELALGTVGRGASLAKQSIDEMLPSIGLVKNTGVDASVAASSVSSALIFMSKNAKKFDEIGVSVTDAQGKIRPFMDIVLDTQKAMEGMSNEAEKTALATKLFGRFGVTAFSAIGTQTANGIRKPTGEIVKGAEAVDFLRKSMEGAAGTASKFREALLDTLPGQIILLKGSIQTLAITLGQPLAEALKPVVLEIKDAINSIITAVQSMPAPMKKALGIGLLFASVAITLGGALLFLGATIALAAPGLAAFGAAISGAALPIAGLVAAILGAAAVVAVLRKAFNENIGGFADTVGPMIERTKLFFKGLFQFIQDGFFSGETAKKLNQPENVGVLKFLVTLIQIGHRAARFVEGLKHGFDTFMASAGPTFEELGSALRRLGGAFGIIQGKVGEAMGPSKTFLDVGIAVGRVIGKLAIMVIDSLTRAIAIYSGFIKGVIRGSKDLMPAFEEIAQAFRDISAEIRPLLEEMGLMEAGVGANASAWEVFGQILGVFVAVAIKPVVQAFSTVMQIVAFVTERVVASIRAMQASFRGFQLIGEGVIKFFKGDFQGGFESVGA